jgi:hypothetical protein
MEVLTSNVDKFFQSDVSNLNGSSLGFLGEEAKLVGSLSIIII